MRWLVWPSRREKEASFGKLRAEMEKAIADGIQPACPSCGIRGIKDDACTHMTCESCQTTWCYVCGLDEAACNKADRAGSLIYRHNDKWWENERRCPMYLSEINQIDESFPADDEEAMAHLHRLTALRNMRCVYDRVGKAEYRKLIAAFPTLGPASGFTEEQILAVDLSRPLFQRVPPGELNLDSEEDDEDDEEDDEEDTGEGDDEEEVRGARGRRNFGRPRLPLR